MQNFAILTPEKIFTQRQPHSCHLAHDPIQDALREHVPSPCTMGSERTAEIVPTSTRPFVRNPSLFGGHELTTVWRHLPLSALGMTGMSGRQRIGSSSFFKTLTTLPLLTHQLKTRTIRARKVQCRLELFVPRLWRNSTKTTQC